MTMQDYDLTAASCVMPVDHIRPCYIWVEYTSDEWSVDVRLSTTKNKTSLVVVKVLPVNGRPLQWHTPRLFLHCLQAPQTSWLIPHTLLTPCGKLQDCSRTARRDKRHKVKKIIIGTPKKQHISNIHEPHVQSQSDPLSFSFSLAQQETHSF